MQTYFTGSPDGNAVLNFHDDMDLIYIIGYKRASDLLVQHVKDSLFDIDTLIYPIAFNYRHYIELLLKKCFIETLDELGESLTKAESKSYFYKHDLNEIFRFFSGRARQLFQKSDDYIGLKKGYERAFEDMKDLVEILHNLDPKSFSFRYWKDKSGEVHLNNINDQGSCRVNVYGLKADVNNASEDFFHYLLVLDSIREIHDEVKRSI